MAKYVAHIDRAARTLPEAALLAPAAESALWRSLSGMKVFDPVLAVVCRPRVHLTAVVSSAFAVRLVTRARW